MENFKAMAQEQKAQQFWNTHFQDLLDTPLDEQTALNVGLWGTSSTCICDSGHRHPYGRLHSHASLFRFKRRRWAQRIIRLAKTCYRSYR